jgi:hypothetical protein
MAIDIGEIRISSKYQQGAAGLDAISSIKNNKAFWDYIAPVRQVYCTSPPYSQANPYTLFSNTCLDNKGAAKLAEVFSGDGTAYPSNDPTADSEGTSYANQTQLYQQSGKLNLWGLPTQYYFAGVYFRNFITGWAYQNGALITNTTFDNFPVVGTNIVPRNNYTPGTDDASKATVSTPLLFPLFYRVVQGHEDFQIRRGFDPYILEVRTNIKENLMVHSWTTTLGVVQTMVGFSDWRNAHNGELDMGGNLLVRARVIYPVTASSLYINGGTRTLKHYYAIYRQAEIDFTNQLPLAASPVKNGTTFIKYLQSGSYRVRCLADTTPQDGYPETVVRETTFNISDYPFNQKININLTCP